MLKFVKAGFKNKGFFFLNEKNEKKWGNCVGDERATGEQVWAFIKKAFVEGDEIEMESYIEKDEKGRDNIMVKRVTKKGAKAQADNQPAQQPASTSAKQEPPKQEEKKTYQQRPNQYDSKSETIIRQTVSKCVAETLSGLQGHISPENVKVVGKDLYLFFYDLTTLPIEELRK